MRIYSPSMAKMIFTKGLEYKYAQEECVGLAQTY